MDLTDKESEVGHDKELAQSPTTSQRDPSFLTMSHQDPMMRQDKEKGMLCPLYIQYQVESNTGQNAGNQV